MSTAASFGALFAALLVAHQLADYLIQTDHQAADKAASWAAMAGHLVGYHAAQLLFAAGVVLQLDLAVTLPGAAAGLALSVVTHGLLDRRWPIIALMRLTRSGTYAESSTGPERVDQALHLAALFCAALLATA